VVSQTSLTGAAGEHFVMAHLLNEGFIAALAPTGVPTADIVVTDDIGDRLCSIQVKTRRELGSDGGWHMSKKHEAIRWPTLFYVFVGFKNDPTVVPDLFVIPSATVAECLQTCHLAWLSTPGKGGKAHNDHDMRRLLPDYSKDGQAELYGPNWLEPYRNAWHLLRAASDI
jgi:hypothetical protein